MISETDILGIIPIISKMRIWYRREKEDFRGIANATKLHYHSFMKKITLMILLCTVFVSGVFLFAPKKSHVTTGKPVIASTILPLSMIVKSIAGDDFDVVTILPAGASPHTYEPTPSTIGKLKGAAVLFAIGHGLDDWSVALAKSAGVAGRVVVDANIRLQEDDPHYFLSLTNAGIIGQTVRDELTRLYPEKKEIFKRNETVFAGILHATSVNAKNALEKTGNPSIATFHGAWNYFAGNLGLQVAAVFEEYPGKEPTPAYLQEFGKQIRTSGVRVIFAEPEFGTTLLEPIAKDLGVKIAILDPEGSANGAKTYDELIQKNVDEIVKANIQ
jgi:zinc transport system substrate-binding protein